jgi:hypothetical protein
VDCQQRRSHCEATKKAFRLKSKITTQQSEKSHQNLDYLDNSDKSYITLVPGRIPRLNCVNRSLRFRRKAPLQLIRAFYSSTNFLAGEGGQIVCSFLTTCPVLFRTPVFSPSRHLSHARNSAWAGLPLSSSRPAAGVLRPSYTVRRTSFPRASVSLSVCLSLYRNINTPTHLQVPQPIADRKYLKKITPGLSFLPQSPGMSISTGLTFS